jgi:hypothetical protein
MKPCKCGHNHLATFGHFADCQKHRPASLEAKACKECGHYPHGLMCCVGVPKPNGLSRMCGCTHGVEKK